MQPLSLLPLLMLVLALASIPLGCGTPGAANPLERTEFWHQYREFPDARAIAIAGNPAAVWVGGAAAGLATTGEAEREALAECERRRARRRLQAPCVVYAVGSEVKWGRRPARAQSHEP